MEQSALLQQILLATTIFHLSSATVWFPGYFPSKWQKGPSSPDDIEPTHRLIPLGNIPSRSSNDGWAVASTTRRANSDGITFQADNSSAWQQRVDGVISRGVLQLALQVDSVQRQITGSGDNVVFSPISIASALALILLGSGGQTYDEVAKVMGLASGVEIAGNSKLVHEQFGLLLDRFNTTNHPGFSLVAASGLFVQDHFPVRPEFAQTSMNVYHSDVINVNFLNRSWEARQTVNNWVLSRTNGKIKDLLQRPPAPTTRVIIASALYFNGAWQHPFPEEITQKRMFHVSETDKLEVMMMGNSVEIPYVDRRDIGCRMIGLPYENGDATMYIILPDRPGEAGLKDLESKLSVHILDSLANSARVLPVIVSLPRMRLESVLHLRNTLQQLGLTTLFNPMTSNLTGISSAGGLYADDVVHKVEIDITETGTVAAAATAVSISRDGSYLSFRVDRPFFFFIRHEHSNLILFWGSVVRPRPSTPVKNYSFRKQRSLLMR